MQRADELCRQDAAVVAPDKITLVSLTSAGDVVRQISQLGTDKEQAAIWRQVPSGLPVATCAVQRVSPSPSLTPCPDGTYAELPSGTAELVVDDSGHQDLTRR